MEKATGGKVKVNIYAADQLTNGNQSEGIQALMNGDPVQISMHSNLIYSAFDPRFNVVSLPFIYDSVEDADAKFDGEAGEKMKEILSEYGLHCMGIAENGFRELTNSVREVKSVDDMKNLKVRVAGSNLLMECYKRWGQMQQPELVRDLHSPSAEHRRGRGESASCNRRSQCTGGSAILLHVGCHL